MHRRRYLALAGLAALAGCTGTSPGGDTSTATDTTTPSGTSETTGSDPATDDDSTAAGPTTTDPAATYPPGESSFEGECPSLDGDVSCYHAAQADATLYLHPSAESLDAAGDRATFTLVNRSDEELTIGPYYWNLWERSDGDWTRLDYPGTVRDLGAMVPPGDTYRWQLTVGDASEGDDPPRVVVDRDLNPGRYAFVVEAADSRYAALFSVE